MGAFMLTEALFRPSLGALSDRIGRKPLMLAGPAIGIFTSIATIYVTNPILMIGLRAIDGIGLAAFWPAAFAAIGDAVEEHSRGTAMSVLNGTGMAGIALGMLLGGMANDLTRSLTGAFYFVSITFFLTVAIGYFVFPHEIDAHRKKHAEQHIPDKKEVEGAIKLVPDMIVLSVIVFAAIGMLMPIVKLYAFDQLGMSETQFGVLVAPVAAVLGLLAFPIGRLGDKWGKMVSVCYGMLLCTVSMWLIAIMKSIIVMAGASALLGIGFALAFPTWMAVISLAAPAERRGQVMGAVGLAQGIGALIGVEIAPIIYTSDWLSLPRLGVDHINLPFYLCAILLSISTVLMFVWISKTRGRQSGGRQVTRTERRAISVVAVLGLLSILGWVVYRYATPVPPDRVAWLWVQSSVHKKIDKAERYTLPSFEATGYKGETTTDISSRVYSYRVSKRRASYRVTKPRYSDNGNRAAVRLIFRYPDHEMVQDQINLLRQSSGEWKILSKHSVN